MKRAGLGVLFYAGIYGVPFLLIVAVIRRASKPWTPTHAAAEAFGATTDTLFITSMTAAVVLPALGLLLSKVLGEPGWARHFIGALVAAPLLFVVLCAAGSTASTPLVGHVPDDLETPSPVRVCAHDCPGG
ncbi:hypothetical protein [Dactylosporangium sp. NPDC005555]|uniref:hypothetical protein n=1 Tax=Dactylosporangium sp. NPDC005555 TaxID=3154889 RepID=UPI00339FCEB5